MEDWSVNLYSSVRTHLFYFNKPCTDWTMHFFIEEVLFLKLMQ